MSSQLSLNGIDVLNTIDVHMGFLYRDITGKNPDSGQYNVYKKDIYLGKVIQSAPNVWRVLTPGNHVYEKEKFTNKHDAAKHLAELAGI